MSIMLGKRSWPKIRKCVICSETFTVEKRAGAQPITCSSECQRIRRNAKIAEWRSRAQCPEHLHGTITGYNTYHCDCDECRNAERLYMRERRNQKKELNNYVNDGTIISAIATVTPVFQTAH